MLLKMNVVNGDREIGRKGYKCRKRCVDPN